MFSIFSDRWRTTASVYTSGAGGSASAKRSGEPSAQKRGPGDNTEVHADAQPAAVDRAAEEESLCGEGWASAGSSNSAAGDLWEKRRPGNTLEDTAGAGTAEPPKSAGTETKRYFVFFFLVVQLFHSILFQGCFLLVKLRIAWDFRSGHCSDLTLYLLFFVHSGSRRQSAERPTWVSSHCKGFCGRKKNAFCHWRLTRCAGNRNTWRRRPWGSLQWMPLRPLQLRGKNGDQCQNLQNILCFLNQFIIAFFLNFTETQPSSTTRPAIRSLRSSHHLSAGTRR